MKKFLMLAIFCGFLMTAVGCTSSPTTKPAGATTGGGAPSTAAKP